MVSAMKSSTPRVDDQFAPRRHVQLPARLQYLGATGWQSCLVVTISPMGAMLLVPEFVTIPFEVRLQIPDDLFDITGVVRHQSGTRVGIAFTTNRTEAIARYG